MEKLTERVSKFTPKKTLQDLPLLKLFVVHLIHFCMLDRFRAMRENFSQ
jgi:hypothetical protein